MPRFWATGKRGCLEQTFAKRDFARCVKYLQVKSRRQTAGRVPQIPAVRRFFASAGEKDWRSFACCETEKEKIVLGASGFAECAGTDAMERKEHFYERRIPETTIYRVAV